MSQWATSLMEGTMKLETDLVSAVLLFLLSLIKLEYKE